MMSSYHCTCACVMYLLRYERLNKLSEKRAKKLQDSKKLQEFLRDVDEVMCVDVWV